MDWLGKRYYSLDSFLKNKFITKIAKISINAGFTCPNRDGTIGYNGCIFCSQSGSGEFAEAPYDPIEVQIENGKKQTSLKWPNPKYIAYFQAFTNTYAEPDVLREKYLRALSCPDVVGISIATRPDCLQNKVLDVLDEINKITYLWVELGFQTSNESSAKLINRGYENIVFDEAVKKLRLLNIDTVAHIIFGLPHETKNDMFETVNYVTNCDIQGLKLQLLHVLKGTDLARLYFSNKFETLSQQDYINIVVQSLKYIPKDIVIHRLTGDGDKNLLIEPKWSLNKRSTLNGINKRLKELNITQGDNYYENITKKKTFV